VPWASAVFCYFHVFIVNLFRFSGTDYSAWVPSSSSVELDYSVTDILWESWIHSWEHSWELYSNINYSQLWICICSYYIISMEDLNPSCLGIISLQVLSVWNYGRRFFLPFFSLLISVPWEELCLRSPIWRGGVEQVM